MARAGGRGGHGGHHRGVRPVRLLATGVATDASGAVHRAALRRRGGVGRAAQAEHQPGNLQRRLAAVDRARLDRPRPGRVARLPEGPAPGPRSRRPPHRRWAARGAGHAGRPGGGAQRLGSGDHRLHVLSRRSAAGPPPGAERRPTPVSFRGAARGRPGRGGRAVITLACWLISVAGILIVAVLGPSAAVPTIPGDPGWPPYSLDAGAPAGVVYAVEVVAVVTGAVAMWRLLTAAQQDQGFDPRWLRGAGFLVAGVLTILPPTAGDITSYLAYGQEAVSGVNPYTAGPQSPGVPQNAITEAVDSPWQTTPSVYGPAFTGISTVIARVAHADGHVAAALTRLVLTAAFVLTGLVLSAASRTEAGRRRAAAMWSANPLMIWALVAGAHVDALVVLPLVCSLALVRRLPLGSGALVGLSAVLKLTGLVALPGLLWAVRSRSRACVAIVLGACAVAVPWYAATSGVFTQLRRASRYSTPASPWRAVSSLLQPVLGYPTARSITSALAAGLGLALVALLLRRGLPPTAGTAVSRAAAITGAFAVGWLLTTPYVLPWYDALAWAPLALAAASPLDRVLLVHTTALTMAFLPGRDVPLIGATDLIHRVLHSGLSPLVLGALILVTVRLAVRRPHDGSLLAVGPRPAR